ncbi:hypothetical protein D9599_03830 [Roseomonas sp. KE2513]|uniref:hypothetical protein n=1 Tax=Roseomonas sp. KE2513 TaxID=2479202 RepID=UPI0018E0209E|nr:hypothetical protein [Roseomonas sp. KE2513]MBI0534699.1 hypothetical protein [Roseomonas sp. KE2513]
MIQTFPRSPEDEVEGFLDAWGGEAISPAYLPGDASGPPMAVRFALLHPAHGVALIDLSPEDQPAAAARFRAAYRARGAGAVPPVVYLSLSEADRWRLTVLLDAAFSAGPGPGGGAWLERARALLSEMPAVQAPVAAAPVAEMPVAEMPVAEMPVAAVPVVEVPVGKAPGSGMPEAPAPVAESRLAADGMAEISLTEALAAQPAEIRLAEMLAAQPAEIRLAEVPVAETAGNHPPEATVEEAVGARPAEIRFHETVAAAAEPGPAEEAGPPAAVPPVVLAAAGSRPGMARWALPLAVLLLAGVGAAAWTGHLPLPGGWAAPRAPSTPPVASVGPDAGTVAPAPAPAPAPREAPGQPVTAAAAPEPEPVEAPAPVVAAMAPGPATENAEASPGERADELAASGQPSADPVKEAEGPVLASALPVPPAGPALPAPAPVPEEAPVAGPVAGLAEPPLPEPSLLGLAAMPSAVAAPRPPPGPVAPEMLAALVRRGDAMMAIGDVSAARLLYERAAAAGSGAAATAMGRSYDPEELAALQVRGLRGDPAMAATWYRRGVALGDPEARGLVHRLASVEGRAP